LLGHQQFLSKGELVGISIKVEFSDSLSLSTVLFHPPSVGKRKRHQVLGGKLAQPTAERS
jgi:hypothetical protein